MIFYYLFFLFSFLSCICAKHSSAKIRRNTSPFHLRWSASFCFRRHEGISLWRRRAFLISSFVDICIFAPIIFHTTLPLREFKRHLEKCHILIKVIHKINATSFSGCFPIKETYNPITICHLSFPHLSTIILRIVRKRFTNKSINIWG